VTKKVQDDIDQRELGVITHRNKNRKLKMSNTDPIGVLLRFSPPIKLTATL
jgi:hypothetical protein